jgi:hypothetical protein
MMGWIGVKIHPSLRLLIAQAKSGIERVSAQETE